MKSIFFAAAMVALAAYMAEGLIGAVQHAQQHRLNMIEAAVNGN